MAAGVISLTGGRTTQGTPDSLGTCGPGPKVYSRAEFLDDLLRLGFEAGHLQ
jgi:hypothetical protein